MGRSTRSSTRETFALLKTSCVRYLGPLVLGCLFGFGCRRDVPSPPPSEVAPPPAAAQPPGVERGRPESVDGNPRQPPATRPPAKPQPRGRQGQDRSRLGIKSFAVYALSRGRGVPPEARAAQLEIQKLLEADRDLGLTVSVETTRIGLEGERRLCVTYKDNRDGARAFERARAIVKGVALVNLVAEPCVSPSSKTGQ
jgi:hypothetical protein